MRAMLNLSLVSIYLGCLAAAALGLATSQLPIAVVSLVIGVLAAEFFYRAAVTQAAELARNIWVGFDLYRYTILEQLREQEPQDIEAERELWQRLTHRLLNPYEPPAAATPETRSAESAPLVSDAKAGA